MRYASFFRDMYLHPEFREAVADSYYNGGIKEALFDTVDEFYRQKESMGYDAELNHIFFSNASAGYTFDYGGNNYDEYCDNMISFYRQRVEWIDSEMTKWDKNETE